MITHLQLIHTEQISIFLTKRGQSIFLYLVSVSPPCFLEMHISLFDNRRRIRKKHIRTKEAKSRKQKKEKQNEYILALTALLSTTTFGIRVYYITVLLFSPREKRNIKNIEKKQKKEYIKSTSGHLLPFYQQQYSEIAFTINIRRHLHY